MTKKYKIKSFKSQKQIFELLNNLIEIILKDIKNDDKKTHY
jgi:hypothetical protein